MFCVSKKHVKASSVKKCIHTRSEIVNLQVPHVFVSARDYILLTRFDSTYNSCMHYKEYIRLQKSRSACLIPLPTITNYPNCKLFVKWCQHKSPNTIRIGDYTAPNGFNYPPQSEHSTYCPCRLTTLRGCLCVSTKVANIQNCLIVQVGSSFQWTQRGYTSLPTTQRSQQGSLQAAKLWGLCNYAFWTR